MYIYQYIYIHMPVILLVQYSLLLCWIPWQADTVHLVKAHSQVMIKNTQNKIVQDKAYFVWTGHPNQIYVPIGSKQAMIVFLHHVICGTLLAALGRGIQLSWQDAIISRSGLYVTVLVHLILILHLYSIWCQIEWNL